VTLLLALLCALHSPGELARRHHRLPRCLRPPPRAYAMASESPVAPPPGARKVPS
jgi:hypothetical protein